MRCHAMPCECQHLLGRSLTASQDGEFAFLRLPSADLASMPTTTPHNAYGLLRAPWNNNPSPFVSRYPRQRATLPSCEEHWTFAKGKDGTWPTTAWAFSVSNKPHGAQHSSPGGVVALHVNQQLRQVLPDSLANGVRQHTLWRFRVIDFPTDCGGADVRPTACAARCNTTLYSFRDVGYEVLKAQPKLPTEAELAEYDDSDLEAIGAAYCSDMDVLVSGDAKDSGGCVDPSFWPIHGALERLYQFRILHGPGFGSDPTEDWPEQNICWGGRSVDADPDHLCFLTAEEPPRVGSFAECCTGHQQESRVFEVFPDQVFGWTNKEMFELLDPRRGPPFDYAVYHHFNWSHCTAVGVDF